ncbi:glutamate synthase [Acidianus sp. HS-5]|uniref:GltB/FmdC/FwdC-like GXGXG domain-containing protein n=1 Tax=Acidianus sp. HS-5 TaxID=2886040 RepID=UPI001F1C4F95|nr:glutamate synthase [Acidianus sp. HS-5]BDC19740.1 glutamate synthase [Acidianus sp. HS-5]
MISPSGCGVFGILRKKDAPKIKGKDVTNAIDIVRYRGSDKGAGFAVFNLKEGNSYYVKAFYFGDGEEIKREIEDQGIRINSLQEKYIGELCDCNFEISLGSIASLKKTVRNINEILWNNGKKGRIYSAGRSLQVYKGVGYPADIARQYNIYDVEGDMWIAHTRQPTNSPGSYPYWSHPFSAFDVAIVHNGDVSSFGANVEFLQSRGWGGFVGTDSEVMAFLFEELISEGLSVEEATRILANPSRRFGKLNVGEDYIYRNARLDGPFTAIIGYNSGEDLFMLGIADRAKFRPVIIGEDENYYYIASEENQIRLLNPNARVWTLEPGNYFIASLIKGLVNAGRDVIKLSSFSTPTFHAEKFDIDAKGLGYKDVNRAIMDVAKTGKKEITVINLLGHRFIGMNFPRAGLKLSLYGVVGNAMANLNENNVFHVYGNVADDCCDTMQGGKVVIHGDARDVLAQTFQGGYIYVKGNAGNRVGIQMREYMNKRPYLVIGGMVDDYLGEYMAGGVILVLGLGIKGEPVGNYVGSGMVGGRIYIRGKINSEKIGLQPSRQEIVRFLKALLLENMISEDEYNELKDMPYVEVVKKLDGEAKKYAQKLFEEKVGIPIYEYRELSEEEIKELTPIIKDYVTETNQNEEIVELLKEKYTVVTSSLHK